MDNKDIPKVHTVRDLGIILSDNMKANNYIHTIRSKSNILCHSILRSFYSANHTLLVNLFKTYVRPVLEYNTCSWSPYLKSDITSVESVQRQFTRKVCQRSNLRFSFYNDRLKLLGLESLMVRHIKQDLIFLYKMLYGLVDINFTEFFSLNNLSGYNLRRHKIQINRQPAAKTSIRNYFFSHRVVKIWNELPEYVVDSPSLNIFKFNLKRLDLNIELPN